MCYVKLDKKMVRVLLSRKRDYALILECVGDGTIMSDLVVCVSEKVGKSASTIKEMVNTLSRYGLLKISRVGKYTVVTKNVDVS